MKVKLTEISSNKKVGPMPVSTTEEASCPLSCPLKSQGCYASYGPVSWQWKKVADSGAEWRDFLKQVRRMQPFQLWRHNQAGDLPSDDGINIDGEKLSALVRANKGRRGFTYTHYTDEDSLPAIAKANDSGFTVNLSANNYSDVDRLIGRGSPVVTIMQEGAKEVEMTAGGTKVVPCPHTTGKVSNCLNCGLCQVADREYVIGFPVHGTGKRKAFEITRGAL